MIEINELLNDDIVKKYVFDGVALPAVSSSDNGKVLAVENGEWVVKTISTAVPTPTEQQNGYMLYADVGQWSMGLAPVREYQLSTDNANNYHIAGNDYGKDFMDIYSDYVLGHCYPILRGTNNKIYYPCYVNTSTGNEYINFIYVNTIVSQGNVVLRIERLVFRYNNTFETTGNKEVTLS